jgi:hypothetical protein
MPTCVYYRGEAYELAQSTYPLPIHINQLNLPPAKQNRIVNCDLTYCVINQQLVVQHTLRVENGINGKAQPAPVQRVRFTGKLLLVRDYFQQNVVGKHKVPFRRIEGYETILELVFQDGCLICTLDHSATMTALRGIAHEWGNTQNELAFLTNLGEWIQAIYGYKYDVWWLPSVA